MNKKKRVAVAEINPHLLCILCGGYYVDATTVIECLHTFCKSCIVRYLETSKFCPICDVLVHKTHPLLSIRPDKSLQNVVYKLIPGLFKNEMCRRKRFYSERVGAGPSSEEDGGDHTKTDYLIPSDSVSVALKPFINQNENQKDQNGFHTRYFNCPAGVTLGQLKRLLRAKFDLPDKHPVIISLSKDDILEDKFTLIDVAYIKSWKKESPLVLYYKIYFNKKVKMEPLIDEKPIKIEEREKYESDEDRSMPKLESEVENLCVIDCEKRSIPKLSPIGELPSLSPPPVFTDVPSREPKVKSVIQSISISKPNSLSFPTYKTIIPAPLRTVPEVVSFSSLGLSTVDSLATGNCAYSYGIGLLANPNGSVPSLFSGSLVDPTKIGGTVLPFGLTLAPSLICAPSSVNNINASFSDHTNLARVGGLNFLNPTESANSLIFSLSNLEPSVVTSVSSHPISSVVACESSSMSNISASKSCKKPKLIKPKKSEKRPIVEEKEVQLTISESGVMIVNEGDISSNQLPGLINPVYSEANDLLTKIESGSLLSSDQYSEDSKESDISDGAEKLAQIKEEISCILNTLSDEAQNFTQNATQESYSSNILIPSLPVVVPSIRADFLSSSFGRNMPCREEIQKIPAESESPKKLIHKDLPDLKKSILDLESKVHNKDGNVSTNIAVSSSKSISKSETVKQTFKKVEPTKSLLSNEPPKSLLASHEHTRMQAIPRSNKEIDKKKLGKRSSQPVGYKTLKISPRGWNPTISREILQKKIISTPKPSKFFKARNSAILSSISEKSLALTAVSRSSESDSTTIKSNDPGPSDASSSLKNSNSVKVNKNFNLTISQSNVIKRSSESIKLNKAQDNKLIIPNDNSLSKNTKNISNKPNLVSTDAGTSSHKINENVSRVLSKNLLTVEKSDSSLYEIPKIKATASAAHTNKISHKNSKLINDIKVQKSSQSEVRKFSEEKLLLMEDNKVGLQGSKNRSIEKAISYLHTKVDSSDLLGKKNASSSLISASCSSSSDVKVTSETNSTVSSVSSAHATQILSVSSVRTMQVPQIPSIQTTQIMSGPSVLPPQIPSLSSVQATQAPSVPSVQATQTPSVLSVQATQTPSVLSVQATQTPSVLSVQATQTPSVLSVQATQVPSVPSVQTTQELSIPSVQAIQFQSVPSVQATQVPSVSSVQATQVLSVSSFQDTQLQSVPSVCTTQVPLIPSIQTTQILSIPSVLTNQTPSVSLVQTTQMSAPTLQTTQIPSVLPLQAAIQIPVESHVHNTQVPVLPSNQSINQSLSLSEPKTCTTTTVSNISTPVSASKVENYQEASPSICCTNIPETIIPSKSDLKQSTCLLPKITESVTPCISDSTKSQVLKEMKLMVTDNVALKNVNKQTKASSTLDMTLFSASTSNNSMHNKLVHPSLSKTYIRNAQAIIGQPPVSSEIHKKLESPVDSIKNNKVDNIQTNILSKFNDIPPLPTIHIISKVDIGLSESQQNLASPVDSASDKENKALKEKVDDKKQNTSVTKEISYFGNSAEKPLHDNNKSLELNSIISKSTSNSAVTLKSADVIKSLTSEKYAQHLQKFSSDTLQTKNENLDGKVKSTLSSSMSSNLLSRANLLNNNKDGNMSKALNTSNFSLNIVETSPSLSSNNKTQVSHINEKPYSHAEIVSTINSSNSTISCNSILAQNGNSTSTGNSTNTSSFANSQVSQSTSASSSNSSNLNSKLIYKSAESVNCVMNQAQMQDNNNSFVTSAIATAESLPSSSGIEICKEVQKITSTAATVHHSSLPTSDYTQCQFSSTSKNVSAVSSTPLTCTDTTTNIIVSGSNCAHTHTKESTVKNTAISHTTTAPTSTSTSDKIQYSLSTTSASNLNTRVTIPNSYSISQSVPISSTSQASNSASCSVAAAASNTQAVSKTISSSQCSYPSVNMENALTATDHSRLLQGTASLSNSNSMATSLTSSQNVQYEGNSGLSSYSQNNCGEGFYFGNSFQNGSFPFFNNFMPFGNVSLPYTTPLNSYGGTSTYSTTPQAKSKVPTSSCNEYSKANTTYSTSNTSTTSDSYQNNSFLSYPTISSVPPTLQDPSKFIQNLLGSSVPNMGNEQQKTNLKSAEELDRLLLQTISSSIAENKIADFFASGSTISNYDNKADKQTKDFALSNAVEITMKQNSQTSNISATTSKGTNSETTAISVHASSEQSPGKVAKGVSYNKDKEVLHQVSQSNTKVGLASSSEIFNSVVPNASNFQKSLIEYSATIPAMTSQAYSVASSAGETYKPSYHQSQCCNHQIETSNSLPNALSSDKCSVDSNLQHNKPITEHSNISALSNVKKNNTLAEKTAQAVSSSSYGVYSGTSQYNSSSVASVNNVESNSGKKNVRSSGCSTVTPAVSSNSAVNNYNEGMPCLSANASASHKHVTQTSSWDSNSLNPFLFNNNGDTYGCASTGSAYKGGYPPNTNSCIQQNMFRNSSSTMTAKDSSMNSHSQVNYNSSANLSCSSKNSLAVNSQYGSDNTKKGISNTAESYDNFSVGSQKYNPSHASLYYSNYNNNYANFFSNSQGQSSPSLTPFVSGAGYNFPLSGSKFTSGQQYLNFSQNNHNNSYFSSGNFNVNNGSNYQNCINQTPSSNTGASNTNSNLGNNFSGPLCNISLPYYSNCSFSYNSYPYFYQGDMSLLSPTASFMPPFSCLPSRPSLSSRNSSSSQSFNDFSLQSGFFPMMPFVSPLQGNSARATPSPMTGGISSSFGARPFSSNYSQKQITHETTKLSHHKADQQSSKGAGIASGNSSNKSKHRKTNNGNKHKSSSTKEGESKLPKTTAITVPTFTPSGGIMPSGSSNQNPTTVNRIQSSEEEGNNNALTEGNRNTISTDNKQQKKKDVSSHVN